MRRLSKFRRLSPSERHLLLEAAVLIAAIRVGLALMPLTILQRLLVCVASRLRCVSADAMPPQRIAWAVAVAGRFLPGSTCLTRALAAQALLVRRDRQAILRIGVATGRHRALAAHAWLESDGEILVGAHADSYTPLFAAGAESR